MLATMEKWTDERQLAQEAWMQGNVQVMVATKAFGLGIDNPIIHHVIRNGVPESISAWVQESGRAGRDGGNATATIFTKRVTDHAGAWIKDYVKNPPVRDDIFRKLEVHLCWACWTLLKTRYNPRIW